MPSRRVLIKPFDTLGSYVDDWIDVTKDVVKIGMLKQDADSLDYQLGVFRNSSFDITFSNRSGRFSDIDNSESYFRFKRNDTQIRVIWDTCEEEPLVGWITLPMLISPEAVVFDGVLSDDATKEDAKTEEIPFKVLGLEALFQRVEVPFASLSIGDTVAEVIFATLNQSPITDLLTVEIGNITPDQDLALDAVDFLENKTGKDLLDGILKHSNSVCFVKDRIVYVTDKDAGPSVVATFYGQASQSGAENIIAAKNLSGGLNRVFNLLYWSETVAKQKNNVSIAKYGVRKEEFNYDGFTNTTKQNTILAAILADFKDPKKELEITVPATYESVTINLFEKITIDYPTVFVATSGFELPICGIAVCGEGVLPKGLWSLTISPADEFKVLSKQIDVNKHEVTLKLRGV